MGICTGLLERGAELSQLRRREHGELRRAGGADVAARLELRRVTTKPSTLEEIRDRHALLDGLWRGCRRGAWGRGGGRGGRGGLGGEALAEQHELGPRQCPQLRQAAAIDVARRSER